MENLSIMAKVFWGTSVEFESEITRRLEGKRVALFVSASSIKRLALIEWYNKLKNTCELMHIREIAYNPTYQDIYSIISKLRDKTPDIILVIGGGSAIDMAKSYAGLAYLGNKANFSDMDVLDSLKSKEYLKFNAAAPIYAVPTTAGTGSEVTKWATIWDMESKIKYSIDKKDLLPEEVYMVPDFTLTMPKRLTLSTGLDALCQAIEAYWAKASNPMVRILSKSAIELIVEYLPKTLLDLGNTYYREKMCLGSLFSGLAFSNTRTTACHSISYPLTMEFDIEHGLACALTLAKVMEINLPAITELDQLLKTLNIKDPKELQAWIDNVSDGIVKMRLSGFGINKSDIARLAGLSFTQGRMDNNPVDLNIDEVRNILASIL